MLEKHLASRRFPHAYFFSGPPEIGKKTLAMEFAAKILNSGNLAIHPDFVILDQNAEITVEQLRDFTSRLALKPLFGAHKVAILNNAELMNRQSANALLKTLEEPSANTIIILVGESRRVPGTIRSRCQILPLQLFSKPQLLDFAAARGIRAVEELVELSYGAPGELVRLAGDKRLAEAKRQASEQWRRLKQSDVAARLLKIAEYSDLETAELRDLLLVWLLGEEASLSQSPGGFSAVAALQEAYIGTQANLNKKSLLQNLLLKI